MFKLWNFNRIRVYNNEIFLNIIDLPNFKANQPSWVIKTGLSYTKLVWVYGKKKRITDYQTWIFKYKSEILNLEFEGNTILDMKENTKTLKKLILYTNSINKFRNVNFFAYKLMFLFKTFILVYLYRKQINIIINNCTCK